MDLFLHVELETTYVCTGDVCRHAVPQEPLDRAHSVILEVPVSHGWRQDVTVLKAFASFEMCAGVLRGA